MANSYTYEGYLNVAGDLRVNGRQVLTEAPKKYDMNGKIVTHRAIPIHTVRPGYRYCFPDGHIYIKGLSEQDLQDESFKSLWDDIFHKPLDAYKSTFVHKEIGDGSSIVVYIPKDFDARAFLTDSAYVQNLVFKTPDGILKTMSPHFEIHNGKNVCIAEIDSLIKANTIWLKGHYVLRSKKQHIKTEVDKPWIYVSKFAHKTRTQKEQLKSQDYQSIDTIITSKIYCSTYIIYRVHRYNRRYIKSIYSKKLYVRRSYDYQFRFEPNKI